MTVIDFSPQPNREADRQKNGQDPSDRSCFDAFYSDRSDPMIALACRLVDQRAIAEEIVQEAFHHVWTRWSVVDSPSGYLRTTVINRCNDELRKRRVRREAFRPTCTGAVTDSDYLADVLSDVAPRRRKALVLRYYGGNTVSEVAAAMDIPTGTAKSLIHRGLADMRCALN